MMMEQQMILKNDDMQLKWRDCVLRTCYAYREAEYLTSRVEQIKEVLDKFWEAVRIIINSFVEVIRPMFEELSDMLYEYKDFYRREEQYSYQSYPQSYPQNVYKSKVNTRGFQRPITHCARSRC